MQYRSFFILTFLLIAGFAFAGGGQEEEPTEPTQPEAVETQDEQAADESEGAPADESSDPDETEGTPIRTGDPERAIATVNGVDILREDYEQAVSQTRQHFQMQGQEIPEAQMESFRTEILDQLIAEELLYQEALRQDLEIDTEAVDTQYDQMRSQFETDEEWQQALNEKSVTESELRTEIERNDLIQKVITNAVEGSTEVTDAEIQTFYDENPQYFQQGEQVAARHILISTEELETDEEIEEARARAEAAREELLDGADFAALAQERSDCPSASRGGELGTF
ncbi:MAG: SurA N-terminal domain-containing protein, partial [Spirochaetota bacterium]